MESQHCWQPLHAGRCTPASAPYLVTAQRSEASGAAAAMSRSSRALLRRRRQTCRGILRAPLSGRLWSCPSRARLQRHRPSRPVQQVGRPEYDGMYATCQPRTFFELPSGSHALAALGSRARLPVWQLQSCMHARRQSESVRGCARASRRWLAEAVRQRRVQAVAATLVMLHSQQDPPAGVIAPTFCCESRGWPVSCRGASA